MSHVWGWMIVQLTNHHQHCHLKVPVIYLLALWPIVVAALGPMLIVMFV